jgi:DNA-directed RNA polymerase subunit RPC12/RpoP
MMAVMWHNDSVGRCSRVSGVASLGDMGDTMLRTFRPTPTCTRFKTSIEMPCMKCGAEMRLAVVEPRDQVYDLLTYRCTPCDSGESFLQAR